MRLPLALVALGASLSLATASPVIPGHHAHAAAAAAQGSSSVAHLDERGLFDLDLGPLHVGVGDHGRGHAYGHYKNQRPSAFWRCDKSGTDGFEVDVLGFGRPFWVPEGWLYFGVGVGWAPAKGWECDAHFDLPLLFIGVIDQVIWWGASLSFSPLSHLGASELIR